MFIDRARSAAAWLIAVAAIFAGVGLTYLLRHASVLAFGPQVHGALPLQQLAGGESQPLGRMAVAWLCAGASAGIALATLSRSRIVTRTLVLTVIAAALLFLAGAISDSVAVSDQLAPHLASQLSRVGIWVAVAFLGIAAGGVGLLWPRPTASAPASRQGGAGRRAAPLYRSDRLEAARLLSGRASKSTG